MSMPGFVKTLLTYTVTAIVLIAVAGWVFSNPAQAGHDVNHWVRGGFSFIFHSAKG